MREQTTRTTNDTRGNRYRLQCFNCSWETFHEVVASVDVATVIDSGEIEVNENFQIVKCLGCETLGFRKSYMCSEDFHPDIGDIEQTELYPPRLSGSKRLSDLDLLPFTILSIYEETFKALCAESPILTAIGIRTLVEAVCAEEEVSGATLKMKIERLVDDGVLTKSSAEILQKLRLLGNEAAHETKRHSFKKLKLALTIVENLLLSIYILPERSDKL